MVLECKSHAVLYSLIFNRPLTLLACHSVRMFVRFWPTYIGQPIFRNIDTISNNAIQDAPKLSVEDILVSFSCGLLSDFCRTNDVLLF